MAGFLDLEDYIMEWAHQMFDVLKSKDEAKTPKEHLDFQINWSKIRFQHGNYYMMLLKTGKYMDVCIPKCYCGLFSLVCIVLQC